MSRDEIGVFGVVRQEDVDGFGRLIETCSCHRHHAIIPSPCALPIPMLTNVLEGGEHGESLVGVVGGRNDAAFMGIGEEGSNTQNSRMVGVAFLLKFFF